MGQCPSDYSNYPVSDNCLKYNNCNSYMSSVYPSPTLCSGPGYVWNCMTKECEPYTFDFCCSGSDPSKYMEKIGVDYICEEGAFAVDPSDDKKFRICRNNTILSGYCFAMAFCVVTRTCYDLDSGEKCSSSVNNLIPATPYETEPGILVGIDVMIECPNDGTNLNIPDDCFSYYNCSSGTAEKYECPPGFIYDCMNDICSTHAHTYCCKKNSSTDQNLVKALDYRCTENSVAFDNSVPEVYYICKNNQVLRGECAGMKYCHLTKSCINKTDICQNTVTQASTITTELTASTLIEVTTTVETTTNELECPKIEQKEPALDSCQRFYYCNQSFQKEEKTCPSYQLFDCKIGDCASVFNANIFSGCTISSYDQCLNSKNWRGDLCDFLTWIPRFVFEDLGNYCKSAICAVI